MPELCALETQRSEIAVLRNTHLKIARFKLQWICIIIMCIKLDIIFYRCQYIGACM